MHLSIRTILHAAGERLAPICTSLQAHACVLLVKLAASVYFTCTSSFSGADLACLPHGRGAKDTDRRLLHVDDHLIVDG